MIKLTPDTIIDSVKEHIGGIDSRTLAIFDSYKKAQSVRYPDIGYRKCVDALESVLKATGQWLAEKKDHQCNLTWLLWNSDVAVVKIARDLKSDQVLGCCVTITHPSYETYGKEENCLASDRMGERPFANKAPLSILLGNSIYNQTTPTAVTYKEEYPLKRFYEAGMSCVPEQSSTAKLTVYLIPIGGDHAERHPHIWKKLVCAREAITAYQSAIAKTSATWYTYSDVARRLDTDHDFISIGLNRLGNEVTRSDVFYELIDMVEASFRRHAISPQILRNGSGGIVSENCNAVIRAVEDTTLTESEKVFLLLGILPTAYLRSLIS